MVNNFINELTPGTAVEADYLCFQDLGDLTDTFRTTISAILAIQHNHVLADITNVTITATNLNILDDGVNTTLHFHDSDRARANHTGTQLKNTISDFAHTHPKTEIDDTGTWETSEIPNLDTGKITTGQFVMARLASGTPDGTKFIRDDGTLVTPPDTGEANTGANVGAGVGTIFRNKTGVTLNFKTLVQGANITLTNNADSITVAGSAGGSGTDEVNLIPTSSKTIPANTSIIVGDYYQLGSAIEMVIESGANLTVT